MRNLILFSIAIASAFVIEGCTSPNEENELETVEYNVLQQTECIFNKVNIRVGYDTVYLEPDKYIPTTDMGSISGPYLIHTHQTEWNEKFGCTLIDWYVTEIHTEQWWAYKGNSRNINSEETFIITDNHQIIHTIKATNEAITFNVKSVITDTSKITERLSSCSKSGFASRDLVYDNYGRLVSDEKRMIYDDTDEPYVLYDIETKYDTEFIFVCKDEAHRSNKVYLYYYYKKEEIEHLERYTLVPAPVNNE